MTFEVFIPNSVERDLKKLDKKALSTVQAVVFRQIAITPDLGKPLQGFQKVLTWKLRVAGVDYRIAYRSSTKEKTIYILFVKSRENFYQGLRRRVGK